jgi:hypothetical protein
MIEREILEKLFSALVNPLTSLQRDGKPAGTCLDVQRINKTTILGRASTPTIPEILQSF